ncbi:tyrosine-type recombinase/integrase [Streptomyces sp. B1866]|uniref:tyrosine-type recombinase/integrase n=1 Tax=Streptomyces sp. B1866 TaxID=3075431 RepID=UPI00289020F7|nr:tyrosine-type recombinase/integrase [Streptomyces sp. B1866]MDT3395313.1 tyrosine-type recombinase/integrase [Streptomyces sp. B1866]
MTQDLRRQLIEGRASVPRVGSVIGLATVHPPFTVVDQQGVSVDPVTTYLRHLSISDNRPLTSRSYAYDLLRWFRLLWRLDLPWDKVTEAEAAVLVGWLRTAPNPQRRRNDPTSPPPGSVNLRTGKPYLKAGYAPSTINHALTVVSCFYAFHTHHSRGPLVNPVPDSPARRRALAHHNPMDPPPRFRRARLRQRVPQAEPRAIPDAMWDEFFQAMTCDRDRAAVLLYVSSGSRASELLGVTPDDIDWPRQRFYVVSKGGDQREPVPASPQALVVLAVYLDKAGMPPAHEPVFRTRRGPDRPLTYWAMRRTVQRANDKLGTNWSLHDMRHTAAERMANDPNLTLSQVRVIMRHTDLATTGRYLRTRVEDLFDALQEHYNRPRVERTIAPGYDPEDFKAVFGGS